MAPLSTSTSGKLRKKGARGWHERWFQLRGKRLQYFDGPVDGPEDAIAAKEFELRRNTRVSSVVEEKKGFFVFRLDWPDADGLVLENGEPVEQSQSDRNLAAKRHTPLEAASSQGSDSAQGAAGQENRRLSGMKMGGAALAGTIVLGTLTAGVGLVAVGVALGVTAAAGGSAIAYSNSKEKDSRGLILAAQTLDDAKQWECALKAEVFKLRRSILFEDDGWSRGWGSWILQETAPLGDSGVLEPKDDAKAGAAMANSSFRAQEFSAWADQASWIPVRHPCDAGLRLFRPLRTTRYPCRRGQLVVNASPLETFVCIMSSNKVLQDQGLFTRLAVVEELDDHRDVVHFSVQAMSNPDCRAMSPRDFCALRSWRVDDNGSYVVRLDSVTHGNCPPASNHVRGEINAVYTLSPAVPSSLGSRCMMTLLLQLDPKGWASFGPRDFASRLATFMTLQLNDVKDAAENTRYLSVFFPPATEKRGVGR